MSKNDETTLPKRLQPLHDHEATAVNRPVAPARSPSPNPVGRPGNSGGLDGLGGGRLP
jgi:hypothetical protein